jgi:hypothetical protein
VRDDVKPCIRSYFNALSSLLNEETLSFWKHFHNGGGWNKTHETGWFLCQTAIMFAMERGDELWLAPMCSCRRRKALTKKATLAIQARYNWTTAQS